MASFLVMGKQFFYMAWILLNTYQSYGKQVCCNHTSGKKNSWFERNEVRIFLKILKCILAWIEQEKEIGACVGLHPMHSPKYGHCNNELSSPSLGDSPAFVLWSSCLLTWTLTLLTIRIFSLRRLFFLNYIDSQRAHTHPKIMAMLRTHSVCGIIWLVANLFGQVRLS